MLIDLSDIESSGSGIYTLEFANEERENYNQFIKELEKDELHMNKFDKINYKGFLIGNWYGNDGQHKYYIVKESQKYYKKSKGEKYLTKELTLESSCGIHNMYETIEDAKVQIEKYLIKKQKKEQFITEKEMLI